jgi:hypothetical protein
MRSEIVTIEQDGWNGPITIWCDAKGCSESTETHCEDFNGALAKAKSRGWRVKNVGSPHAPEWEHLCPDETE